MQDHASTLTSSTDAPVASDRIARRRARAATEATQALAHPQDRVRARHACWRRPSQPCRNAQLTHSAGALGSWCTGWPFVDVVVDNLRLAYPEKDDAWINAITRKAYEHLGREATAMMRLSRLDPRQSSIELSPSAGTRWRRRLAKAGAYLLVTGHYGNWEIAAASVAARGIPIAAIVRRQGNRLVDERLQELRRKWASKRSIRARRHPEFRASFVRMASLELSATRTRAGRGSMFRSLAGRHRPIAVQHCLLAAQRARDVVHCEAAARKRRTL